MARREFQVLEKLMPRVLVRLAEASGRAQALAPVWGAVVGEPISRHAIPSSLEGGTLTLQVSSPEWAQALAQQESALLERLQAQLGPGAVRTLVFRLEPPCSPSR